MMCFCCRYSSGQSTRVSVDDVLLSPRLERTQQVVIEGRGRFGIVAEVIGGALVNP